MIGATETHKGTNCDRGGFNIHRNSCEGAERNPALGKEESKRKGKVKLSPMLFLRTIHWV